MNLGKGHPVGDLHDAEELEQEIEIFKVERRHLQQH